MSEITQVSGDYGEYGESVEGSFVEVGLRHDSRRTSVKSSPSATLDQRYDSVLYIENAVYLKVYCRVVFVINYFQIYKVEERLIIQ